MGHILLGVVKPRRTYFARRGREADRHRCRHQAAPTERDYAGEPTSRVRIQRKSHCCYARKSRRSNCLLLIHTSVNAPLPLPATTPIWEVRVPSASSSAATAPALSSSAAAVSGPGIGGSKCGGLEAEGGSRDRRGCRSGAQAAGAVRRPSCPMIREKACCCWSTHARVIAVLR